MTHLEALHSSAFVGKAVALSCVGQHLWSSWAVPGWSGGQRSVGSQPGEDLQQALPSGLVDSFSRLLQ